MAGHDDDEVELRALIDAQRIAYWMRDFDAWARCHVQEPHLVRWGWRGPGGIFVRRGWDDISQRFKRELDAFPEPSAENAYDTRVEKLRLRILGDAAWASFEHHYPNANPVGRPRSNSGLHITQELRFFERIDGRWKVSVNAFLSSFNASISERSVVLDNDGRVLRGSDMALAALAEDDDLVVRNGRLRVRSQRADQSLQQAIARASAVDAGYFSSKAAFPVVMDAGADLPARVWWVLVNDGQISFSFGTHAVSEERLAVAGQIFDLSPTQLKLAALLMEGRALPDIADRMGITHNTARTHLRRVYEKTGVNTQTALIRVLLSTTSPL